MAEPQTVLVSRKPPPELQAAVDAWNAKAARAGLPYRASARLIAPGAQGKARLHLFLRLPAGKIPPVVVRAETPEGVADAIARLLAQHRIEVPFTE